MSGDLPTDILVTARIATVSALAATPPSTSAASYYMIFSMAGAGTQQSFFEKFFREDYIITQEVPPPEEFDGNIVVQATVDQVEAAKAAYASAGVNLTTIKVMLNFLAAGYGGIIGGGIDNLNLGLDLTLDNLRSAYADILYAQDAADGVQDGYASEIGEWQGFFRPSGGTGPYPPRTIDGEGPQNSLVFASDHGDEGQFFLLDNLNDGIRVFANAGASDTTMNIRSSVEYLTPMDYFIA